MGSLPWEGWHGPCCALSVRIIVNLYEIDQISKVGKNKDSFKLILQGYQQKKDQSNENPKAYQSSKRLIDNEKG